MSYFLRKKIPWNVTDTSVKMIPFSQDHVSSHFCLCWLCFQPTWLFFPLPHNVFFEQLCQLLERLTTITFPISFKCVFYITHYWRNANQNHNEISSHTVQNGHHKKSTNNKCWRGCTEKGTLLYCWWKCKLVQALWRTVWRFLKKLRIKLPHNPVIPLLGIFPEETRTERDTYTPNFIAALFSIARSWKQPKCALAEEWIRTLWYMCIMDYYSAIKRNACGSVLMRWVKLKLIYYTEWSKSERKRQILYINAYIWNLERWYWWSYMQGSRHRRKEQTFGLSGRR